MEQFQNQGCGNQAGFPNVPPTPYMGFVDAIKVCFNKYATFTGRASRAEYWWWVLFTFVVGALCSMFGHVGQYVSGVASLAFLVPSLAVAWRRMHDIGKGGGWYPAHPHRGLDSVDCMVLQALRTVPQPFR